MEQKDPTRPGRLRWIGGKIGKFFGRSLAIVWATLLGIGIGVLAERQGLFSLLEQPTVAEQLDKIRRDAASDSRYVIEGRKLDLHGTQTESYLFVFRHNTTETIFLGKADVQLSDEIRIYDNEDGDLRLRLRFEPESLNVTPSIVDQTYFTALEPRILLRTSPYVFQLDAVEDLDGNGRPEILGAFRGIAMAPYLPRPILINWDELSGDYVITPLLSSEDPQRNATRPRFSVRARPGTYAAGAQRGYAMETVFRDTRTGESFSSFGAEDFLVDTTPNGPVLVAAFVVEAQAHADEPLLEIQAWSLRVEGSRPVVGRCTSPRFGEAILVRARERIDRVLTNTWRAHRARTFCGSL